MTTVTVHRSIAWDPEVDRPDAMGRRAVRGTAAVRARLDVRRRSAATRSTTHESGIRTLGIHDFVIGDGSFLY